MKKVFLILLFLLLMLQTSFNSSYRANSAGSLSALNTSSDEILVGASFLGPYEYPKTLMKIMIEEAKQKEIRLITHIADFSNSKQLGQIKDLISQNVDVLILNSADVENNTEGLNLAAAAGIPVIVVNTLVNSNQPVSYIGPNDIEAGEISMQYISEKLDKQGNIIVLSGKNGQSSQIQRNQGIQNVLSKYPNIHLLEEVSGEWSSEKSYKAMSRLYLKYGNDIHAVIAHNDEMALGASKFLQENNLKKQILVIGTDGITSALQAIKNGEIDATVFQEAEGQAKLALEAAIVLANNGSIAKTYFLPYKLVTKENVDFYINKKAMTE